MAGYRIGSRGFLRTLPVLLLMGMIFFLSHQNGESLPMPQVPYLDKLAHFMLYGALAAAALFSLPDSLCLVVSGRVAAWVILFCLAYGITDELHQTFIPARDASIGDLFADVLGAAFMTFLWFRFQWQKFLPLPEPGIIGGARPSKTSGVHQ